MKFCLDRLIKMWKALVLVSYDYKQIPLKHISKRNLIDIREGLIYFGLEDKI